MATAAAASSAITSNIKNRALAGERVTLLDWDLGPDLELIFVDLFVDLFVLVLVLGLELVLLSVLVSRGECEGENECVVECESVVEGEECELVGERGEGEGASNISILSSNISILSSLSSYGSSGSNIDCLDFLLE